MINPKQYLAHLQYKFIALFGFVFVCWCGWMLTHHFTLEMLFFFCISLALFGWSCYNIFSYVELMGAGIRLMTPIRPGQTIEFRQLISVSENGRFTPVLTLVYHPRQPNGLLDLDDVRSLILPAVIGQAELLTLLEARLPA